MRRTYDVYVRWGPRQEQWVGVVYATGPIKAALKAIGLVVVALVLLQVRIRRDR